MDQFVGATDVYVRRNNEFAASPADADVLRRQVTLRAPMHPGRYFNDSDAVAAGRVRERLAQIGFPQTSVQKSPLKANPGNIEVWYGVP